jgi:hypothetical protein
MIIGISGKKGHGKDTVGEMLRTALYKTRIGNSWKIRKFADTLKDIVCLLIGCTRQQLEDHVFKNTPLGKEWEVWYCFHYKLQNTNNPTGRVSKLCITHEQVVDEFNKLSTAIAGHTYTKTTLTPRLLLQLLGTECGRDIIHPNIWINALFSKYKHRPMLEYPSWIITDVRFINEVEAIKERGGIIIRVNNPNVESTDIHISETELDNYPFDYIIENGSTLNDLRIKVQELVRTTNILNI